MNVFNGITANDGEKTIQQAMLALVDRAQELKLSNGKWSLAELRLDHDDVEWLRNWATHLSGIKVHIWLVDEPWRNVHIGNQNCSHAAAMGTLLLLLTAETARRKATEGILWATFPQECFAKSTLRLLYVNGQPTRAYKDAVESAARWLNLRHVFGIAGLQNWFDTVYLQFGFTYRGFMRRLPEWLVGQGRTQAMQHLLEGPMRCGTFSSLWDALRNYRRGNIKLERLKLAFAQNPWVLPEWFNELATQATARIELGDGGGINQSEGGNGFEPFLDEPQLRWNAPSEPQFICHAVQLARFDLSESVYYVIIAERICTQIRQNYDGNYIFYPSDEIILPVIAPFLVATLISHSGQIIASSTLQLWDTSDEVTIFRAATGKRIHPWQDMMRTEAAYFLITSPDLELSPEPPQWRILDKQGTKLSLLDQQWSPLTGIQLAGHIFWQPNITGIANMEEPAWTRSVDILLHNHDTRGDTLSFGDTVQVMIRHPKSIQISYIRLGKKALNFTEDDEAHTLIESVIISPDMLSHGSHITELSFTIGVKKDTGFAHITRAISIAVVGAAMQTTEGWMVLDPDMTMTVDQARILPVQIFRPNIKRWALMEGDIWLGRPHYTPRPIGSLAGLGAPVQLRQGPYNALEKDIPLVHEIIDRGVIRHFDSKRNPSTSYFIVHLTRPIELDRKHQIILWNEDDSILILDRENSIIEADNMSWSLQLPQPIPQPLIIAVAFDGIRLGTWWSDTWYRVLHQNSLLHPSEIATWLRWFQLPLLSNRWFSVMKQFACSNGSAVLPVWLSEDSSQIDVSWSAIDDLWLSAVRTLFRNWRPNDMASRMIVGKLGGSSETSEELLLKTAWKLLRVDPLLMGKVLRMYARNVCLPQLGVASTRKLMRTIAATFAESSTDANLYQYELSLLEQVSNTMDYTDTQFIRRGLIVPALNSFRGRELTTLEENNITLALNIEPFRRLLGMKILENIEQVIVSGR